MVSNADNRLYIICTVCAQHYSTVRIKNCKLQSNYSNSFHSADANSIKTLRNLPEKKNDSNCSFSLWSLKNVYSQIIFRWRLHENFRSTHFIYLKQIFLQFLGKQISNSITQYLPKRKIQTHILILLLSATVTTNSLYFCTSWYTNSSESWEYEMVAVSFTHRTTTTLRELFIHMGLILLDLQDKFVH